MGVTSFILASEHVFFVHGILKAISLTLHMAVIHVVSAYFH
jgi:hypothetical protein